ncbi:MAG TPA: hypothetical protein V6C78_25695 [Crinalium sp.]
MGKQPLSYTRYPYYPTPYSKVRSQEPSVNRLINTRTEGNAKRFLLPTVNRLRKGFGERRSLPNGGLGASPQKSP